MKPVKFHPQAEHELAEGVDFYNDRIPGLSGDFFTAVKLTGRQIQSSPLRRLLRCDGTHKIKLPRFPYSLVYRDQSDRIEIVAVAYSARRLGYWHDRL